MNLSVLARSLLFASASQARLAVMLPAFRVPGTCATKSQHAGVHSKDVKLTQPLAREFEVQDPPMLSLLSQLSSRSATTLGLQFPEDLGPSKK